MPEFEREIKIKWPPESKEVMLTKNQKGQTLIEVLIAIAILGVVAVAFLTALTTASGSLIIADEHTTAESLARSQQEYVKSQDYDASNNPPQYSIDPSIIPDGYSVELDAIRLDPEGDGTGDDDGIQEITVKVYHNDIPDLDYLVLSTADYKVDR